MRDKFVNIAKSQIGIKETGTNNVKYNTWYYGKTVNGTTGTSEYAWCVTFICWCANQVGILNTLIPRCNNVGIAKNWYNAKGLYFLRSNYTPKSGDLIIFKNTSHIGIVEKTDGKCVWTIEGNSKDRVSHNVYGLTDSYIQGYCKVKFDNSSSGTTSNTSDATISSVQKELNSKYGTGLKVDGIYGSNTKKGLVRGLQKELNKQFNAKLETDGIFGSLTKSRCPLLKFGAKGNITWLVQAKLICLGYKIGLDGDYGDKTKNAIIQFQKIHGLKVDGECGKNTFEKLFK